jgi:hypothetical protein
MLVLSAMDDQVQRDVRIEIWQRPQRSVAEHLANYLAEETDEERRELQEKEMLNSSRRLSMGMSPDGSVSLVLNDARGRENLRLRVDADGSPHTEGGCGSAARWRRGWARRAHLLRHPCGLRSGEHREGGRHRRHIGRSGLPSPCLASLVTASCSAGTRP